MKQKDISDMVHAPIELGLPLLDHLSISSQGVSIRRFPELGGDIRSIRIVNADGVSIEELQDHIASMDIPLDVTPIIETESTPNGVVIKIGAIGSGRREMLNAIVRHLTEDQPPSARLVLPPDPLEVISKDALERFRELELESLKRPDSNPARNNSMADFVRNKK